VGRVGINSESSNGVEPLRSNSLVSGESL
jgi:hypothetical protein